MNGRVVRTRACAAVLLAVIVAGCTTEAPSATSTARTPIASSAESQAPSSAPPASTQPSEAPDCAGATLASLSVEQRVGQLLMIKLPSNLVTVEIRDAVAGSHIGNAWFGRSTVGVAATRRQADTLQGLATAAATDGVRFLVSANQEGGEVQGLSGPGFDPIPSAVVQGTWSTDKLEADAATWGGQLLDAGVNTNFAPVSDVVPTDLVDTNAPIGQLHREYGHDPQTVADHVAAFIQGMEEGGVAPTAKHFPGLGRVVGNTDSTADVVDDVTTLDDDFLQPFAAAIDAQTPFVMISLATYTQIDPKNLAVFSPAIMRDLLRGDLGFDGVIMSDSLSATAVKAIPSGDRAIRFISAGGDLIVLTPIIVARAMARAMVAKARVDKAFAARVDDAALRILEAKDDAGLLPCS